MPLHTLSQEIKAAGRDMVPRYLVNACLTGYLRTAPVGSPDPQRKTFAPAPDRQERVLAQL